uniref:Uncharacterized protein n=1 Tax=Heterosigma akashiwo TaxID=2829 RepID=A0A6V1PIK8_HETAK
MGADLEAQDNGGGTALHYATLNSHGEVVKHLVDKGANLDAQDNDGRTALHYAALNGHGEVIKLLVDKGANIVAQNNGGETALHSAAAGGRGEVVKLLVDKGANLDAQDNDGRTALHSAITSKQTDGGKCIDFLLQKHAEKRRQTANGIQEGLIYSSVLRACEDAEKLVLFKSNLLTNISHKQSNDSIMNVLGLFAVLIDSRRAKSFKFSDDEISKIGKVLAGSLAQIVSSGLFNTPLATLALLAGALGNRARLRVVYKSKMIFWRSGRRQFSFP